MRRRIAAGWHEELARAAATAYAIEHFCALHLHRLRAGPEPWEDA
jgi:hypothetical protein